MFDWARGSVLKKMIEHKITGAQYDTWLKGWSNAWPLALLEIPRGTRVLDVGTGTSMWYPNVFADRGCQVHVLDRTKKVRKGQVDFGLSKKVMGENPDITFHVGLAGEYKGPAKYFDLITCISVMEHVYDHNKTLDPKNPYPHIPVLHDMSRMLAPGGVLALTYDFFVGDMPHHRGWDYLADYEILQYMGLLPLYPAMQPKSRTYIYNHEDTLFMQPEGILSFSDRYLRSTSIGMIFVKPGQSPVKLHPKPKLAFVLLPQRRIDETEPTVAQIGQIMSQKTRRIVTRYLKRFTKKGKTQSKV